MTMRRGNEAGSHRRRLRHRRRRRTFIPERPHFISIIVTEAEKNVRLRIPNDFLERYQIDLPRDVFLKMPSRALWRIGLRVSDDDVWMEFGWTRFTKFYSIRCGQFLVFRYDGGTSFNVMIVDDSSGMEIEYPVRDTVPGKIDTRFDKREPPWDYHSSKDDEDSDGNDGNEDDMQEEDPIPVGMMQPNTYEEQAEDPIPVGMMQPNTDEKQEAAEPIPEGDMQPNTDEEQEAQPIPEGDMQPNTDEEQEAEPIPEGDMQPITVTVEAKALDRVSSFLSEHPYFVVFMLPSHVSGNYLLFLPADFSKIYFKKIPATITLSISDDRIWSFSCHGRRSTKLSICWDSFACDNKLKAGDVCVFELIERSENPLLRVVISRDKDTVECAEEERPGRDIFPHVDKLPAVEQHKSKISPTDNVNVALEKAVALKSQYPSFIVVLASSYPNYRGLHVPAAFEETYLSETTMIKLSVSDGRTWFLKHSGNEYSSISWFAFVKDNNMKKGDACTFELIERGSIPEFNVTVFRGEHPDDDNKEGSKHNAFEMIETSATKGNEKNVTIEGDNKEESKCNTLEMTETPARKRNEKKVNVEEDNKVESKRSTLELTETPATKGKEKNVTVEGDNKVDCSRKNSAYSKSKCKILETTEALPTKDNEKKVSAFERASANFKSSYPFFVKHMRKTYLSPTYNLPIPAPFAREHLISIKPTQAMLYLPDGRYWLVRWFCRGQMQNDHSFVWDSFALQNDLHEEDACAFELITKDCIIPTLRVTIFRGSDNERQPPPSTIKPCTALESAKAFRSNLPYFIITVNSSHLFGNYGLYVPLPFSRKYFMNKAVKSVTLQVRGRPEKWSVNCCYISTREGVVYLGWRQFAAHNSMQLGDMCAFELIDQIKPVYEVVMFRAG